ncbi:MAG: Choice-of-anchor protein [Ignavibacteria bacterium]|nr:Choice-of-anchor protein [Ignavibacteria bacterium]
MKSKLVKYGIIFSVLFFTNILYIGATVYSIGGPYFYSFDYSSYRTIKVNYLAKEVSGTMDNYILTPADFEISENDVPMKEVFVDCSEKADTPGVSVLILIDNSKSLDIIADPDDWRKETKMKWVRDGICAFIDSLFYLNGTKIAMVEFVNNNKLWLNFTDDTAALKHATLSSSTRVGSTIFDKAFISNVNVFDLIKNQPKSLARYLLFVTDGPPEQSFYDAQSLAIADAARDAQTIIIAVSCVDFHDPNIIQSSNLSGGIAYTGQTKEEFISYMQLVAGKMQDRKVCQVTWKAPLSCDENQRTRNFRVSCKKNPATFFTGQYTAPASSLTTFSMTPSKFYFGEKPIGEQRPLSLEVVGANYVVNDVKFEPPNTIILRNWGGQPAPFTLNAGEKRTFTMELASSDTKSQKVTFSIVDDGKSPCPIAPVTFVTNCGGTALAEHKQADSVEINKKKSQTVKNAFTNTTADTIIVQISVEGTNASNFRITSGTTKSLPPQGTLDVTFEFAPSDVGTKTANIKYTLPQGCKQPITTAISGIGFIQTGVEERPAGETIGLSLSAEPNPSSDVFNITFSVKNSAYANLELYNSMGCRIDRLIGKDLPAGSYTAEYVVSTLPAGAYFFKLESNGEYKVIKVIVK